MSTDSTTQVATTNIEQVRRSLLDTIADLRDRSKPMEVDRARAIAQVASVIVDSAKVEVDFLRVTEGIDSEFLKTKKDKPVPGVLGTTVHKLR